MLLASTITRLAKVRSVPASFGRSSSILPELAELQLLSARYPFSRRAISIIRFLAGQWGLDLQFAETIGQDGDRDDLCLPIPGTMNFFCPNLEVLATSSQERIDSTLFRPFPMQGLPLLSAVRAGMEKAGLQLIR
jgi:hypothetical protein